MSLKPVEKALEIQKRIAGQSRTVLNGRSERPAVRIEESGSRMVVIEYISMLILLFIFVVAVLHLLNGTFLEWFTGKFKVA